MNNEGLVRMSDNVNHPLHYGGEENVYEAIKVIEAWGLDKDFCLGNTVKYISRAGKKDPSKIIEDLEKARWYLDRKIQQIKKDLSIKNIIENVSKKQYEITPFANKPSSDLTKYASDPLIASFVVGGHPEKLDNVLHGSGAIDY